MAADRLTNRGVKGTLSIAGSGGELYWEVLLVGGKPATLFLPERGAVRPLRIDTPFADALYSGCDSFTPGAAPSGR